MPGFHLRQCPDCTRRLPSDRFFQSRQNICKDCRALRDRLRAHNMTAREYDRMQKDCAGCCEICGVHEGDRLHVDHSHATGKTRGLLCRRCNTALGLFDDNSVNLVSAALYLETRT